MAAKTKSMGSDLDMLRRIAEYQFGPRAGEVLFPADADLTVTQTVSGRPRQIKHRAHRLATYRTDGRLTLGIAGGVRLANGLPAPAYRVCMGEESEPYIKDGRNAFAKFVHSADDQIRPEDEVLIVSQTGSVLGVGRAVLSGEGMLDFETGMAVAVREGADG